MLPLPRPMYAPGTRPAMSTTVQGSSRAPLAARPCAVTVRCWTNSRGSAPSGAAQTAGPTFGSIVLLRVEFPRARAR
eukprot:scaffold32044_cov30-Tisochrysis_lutea.AAC.2